MARRPKPSRCGRESRNQETPHSRETPMNRKAALVGSLVLLAVSAWAQMDSKPGAEVKKLEYFVGTWSVDATVGQGPWGAGGKFNSTNTSEWMTGNFFLQGHSDFKMPPEIGGEGKEVSFTGYD